MDRKHCLDERLVDIVCGAVFLLLALFMVAMGVTFLPVIGVVLAIPVLYVSWSFLSAPPPRRCLLP